MSPIRCRHTLVVLVLLVAAVRACGPGRGIGGPRRSRKISALVFKQHVPNVSENTLGAAGLQEGAISRHDAKFQDLVPNYKEDIIFKDEEGTGADRFMSQRCKEKLDILAVSVMNEWPGVKVRVTEGWDEELVHGSHSLHYEGRAVDITTSDRDRSKNGMLARLAVEAGFDWVYYESRAHVHCSVKSDSSQASHSSGCFTGNSTVQTSTGERRKLSELKLGERVLSMDTLGNAIYSEVIMFMDRDATQSREFVRLDMDGGASITATPGHLLLVWKYLEQDQRYMFAEKVEEGDFLLVHVNGTLAPRKVLRVSAELHRGVYAPLTREGTIVVNDVTASCYAMVDSQSIAHWSFLPARALSAVQSWFTSSAAQPETSRQSGIHWYANALYSMKDFFLPSAWIYQT